MRKQTDLAAMKQLARVFLMMDPEPTSFSPVIIKHPFTDSGIVTVKIGNEYRVADITADEAVRSQWREQMASLIENAETPRHIYMMLTKFYRFAFLKYAMPYFSQKDFSEYLADAWVMCESPNNDPKESLFLYISVQTFRRSALLKNLLSTSKGEVCPFGGPRGGP